MNLATLLVRAARLHPARMAVALGTAPVLDHAALARRTAALASGLRDRFGLATGDRVAILMKNHPAYLEALFACWWAGLAAVPVNAKLHAREIGYILGHSEARLCLVTDDLAETAADAARDADAAPAILAAGSKDWQSLCGGEGGEPVEIAPDDLAWLFYTSGTTGRPKGAMLTHRNLFAMTACYFMDVDRIAPGDSILHAAPLSHGSGLYVLPHMAKAATQVIPESGGFDPAEIFDLLPRHGGVTIFAAPTMVHRLAESPLAAAADTANLKTIVYGGGPMYLADCRRAMAIFGDKLAQIYGQGESPMTITALSQAHHADRAHPRHEARLASVGVAQSLVEVRIADAADRALPPDEAGEVLVRGDTVMAGYWRDPEATAEALRGGWLHTGDVGRMDGDGFLTLMDRSKDLIISGGANVYPREVEEVLLAHDEVAEVSVIGRPDPDWGETVFAFVVAKPGAAPAPEDLDRLCLERIARFKRPKGYRIVDALPKNNYGKVLKTALRERLAEEPE
ncbi:MAG: AMP-binding protein [Rhodospirillaceae bacterium]|jgi:long-chain acyl-CoA synthetase|nr:AMP-binding protein [Rhodospirillaceae bacterium]MBT6119014.1 AMP-binding protein [Rhodospirillaceae bacterium]